VYARQYLRKGHHMSENIHNDIRDIRNILTNIAAVHAATDAKLDTLLDREIPALWATAKGAQSTADQAKAIASKVSTRLKIRHAYFAGYAAGAGLVASFVFFVIKIVASKWFGVRI
jgi:DNA-binding FrmR family transcriptional regulator